MKLVSVLAVAIVAAACTSGTGLHDVGVTITSDRSTIAQGDTAHVSVTIVNRGVTPVQLSGGPCTPQFVVSNAVGQVMQPYLGLYCALVDWAPLTIAPGASVILPASWSGDVSTIEGPSRLPPGLYFVSARVPATGGTLTSAPIDVHVQ